MIRSFFAIDLPESFIEEIRRLQGGLRRSGADVKWVRPESVHLTLKFLGDVAEEVIEPLAESAGRAVIDLPPIRLTPHGLGVFPGRGRPRVIWLGLDGDLSGLTVLQGRIEDIAADHGFGKEKRAFTPHLTLGRVRSTRGRSELIREMDRQKPGAAEFIAREVILFKSDLKPSGAVYTALKRLSLKGDHLTEDMI